MSGVGPAEYGLASGVVNTSFMMGGYDAAFLVGALFVAAIALAVALLRGATMSTPGGHGAPEAEPPAIDGSAARGAAAPVASTG